MLSGSFGVRTSRYVASEAASRFSTVRFSPDVVGDLGAPLSHGNWADTRVTAAYALSSPNSCQKAWEMAVENPLATGVFVENHEMEQQLSLQEQYVSLLVPLRRSCIPQTQADIY